MLGPRPLFLCSNPLTRRAELWKKVEKGYMLTIHAYIYTYNSLLRVALAGAGGVWETALCRRGGQGVRPPSEAVSGKTRLHTQTSP